MLDISLAYTWSVCWLYMAAWGLVWEAVTNTQHDTVWSLCQQLKHFGELWLWVAESSCLVHPCCEPRWIRASQVQQNLRPTMPKQVRPSMLPRWIKHYQTLEAVAPPSVRQQALNIIGVGMGDEWVSILFISMILDALWNSMMFRQGSKATQQDHVKKKKLLTTTAAWHGPMCPSHDFLSLHNSEKSVVANGCKLGRVKHA